MINVTAVPRPFSVEKIHFDLEDDCTIDHALCEIVEQAEIDPAYLRHAAVLVNERPIPKDQWSTTYPGADSRVVIVATAQGAVIPLLVQVASLAASTFIPKLLGLKGLAAFAVKAAITVGSTLIAQALTPGPKQTLSSGTNIVDQARQSITGVQNAADPYGYVPKIYGRMTNFHPPLAAQPYIDVQGAEQRLHMLFCVGMGRVDISNVRIGNTPIGDYEGATWQERQGTAGQSGTSLYPDQVTEEQLSIKLTQGGGYQERTTPVDTDEIYVVTSFPTGLMGRASNGATFFVAVKMQVQYRSVSGGSWSNPTLQRGSGHITLNGNGQYTVSARRADTVHGEVFFEVPRGQYEVRMRRVTVDDQSDNEGEFQTNTQEDSYWSSLRTIKHEDPLNLDGLALIAVRVKANDQLNGVIDQLSCDVEAYLPVYNGSTWSTQKTRNPAWAYVDALTGNGNAEPVEYDDLDLDAILAWAQDCEDEPRYFDGILNSQSTVWDVIHDIAATGRASPTLKDGKYSVIQGKQQTDICGHISPRNSRNFTATKIFQNLPHAMKVRFPNYDTLHQIDEVIAYDDGYDADNATRFEVLDLPYTTDALQAWRDGRFALASVKHRPEIFSVEMDLEHIAFTRGDLVRVVHDAGFIGLGTGRIKTVTTDGGGNVTDVSVDMPVTMESDKEYAIRIRKADGVSVVGQIDTNAGEQSSLTFSTAIDAADPLPEVGDLFLFGENGRESMECLIRSIEPQDNLAALVTFVQDAPEVYTADSEPIGNFDPNITRPPIFNPPKPPALVVTGVASDEFALYVDNTGRLVSQIVISWTLDSGGGDVLVESIQIRYRVADTDDAYQALPLLPPQSDRVNIRPVQDGVTYQIQLRTISRFGAASDWAEVIETVIGQSTPPADIETVLREGDFLIWDYPDPPLDFAGFVVRANWGSSTVWDTAAPLFNGIITDSKVDVSTISGNRTVLIRAIDQAGNTSETSAVVTLNNGDPLTDNLLLTQDEAATFFANGTITDGTVNGTDLEADTDSDGLFWTADTALFWNDDGDDFYPSSTYKSMSYVAFYDPVSDHIGATIKLALTVTGAEYTVDYRKIEDPDFWTSDGASFWSSDSAEFWEGSPETPWLPFNGEVGPLTAIDMDYEFRIITEAGTGQGIIEDFQILVDVPDIIEYIEDEAIAATGTNRLPITKTYRAIKVVNITVQDTGGGGGVANVLDKDESAGPHVETLDFSGTRAARTIDATIIGY